MKLRGISGDRLLLGSRPAYVLHQWKFSSKDWTVIYLGWSQDTSSGQELQPEDLRDPSQPNDTTTVKKMDRLKSIKNYRMSAQFDSRIRTGSGCFGLSRADMYLVNRFFLTLISFFVLYVLSCTCTL